MEILRFHLGEKLMNGTKRECVFKPVQVQNRGEPAARCEDFFRAFHLNSEYFLLHKKQFGAVFSYIYLA